MITEPATVIRVRDDIVWVRCDAQQGCQRCAEGRGCGGGLLGRLLGDRLRTVKAVRGEYELAPGEAVLIGLAESAVVRASVTMYLVPLLTMLAAAMAAGRLAGGSEGWTIAGGVAGFLGGLLYARGFGARRAADPRYHPVVVRRLASDLRPGCNATA